jgi:Zn-dependent peptidase ImmA (M78 family)/transcriptional regulator with XRE-family HTH domain
MTPVTSEVIGRRVADARTRAGLTQTDLARAVGLDRSALAKIENGMRRVTALELARIVEQTGEPFEWFTTDPPPAINSYRTGTGSSTTSSIDRALEQVTRNIELVQSLGHLNVVAFDPLGHPEDVAQAVRLATLARDLLGLDLVEPVADIIGPMATFGLFAFSENLGPDAPDAATALLEHGGASMINSDRAVGRRRLALAHEFGHYLLADEYTVDWRIGFSTSTQRTEWLIDGFARALLLPTEALNKRWPELTARGSVREAAVRVASEYRVDMATLAARLSDLDLAGPEELSMVRATRTTRSDIIEHDLVVAHDLEETTLPRRYEKAVLGLYRAERISADRATDLLRGTVDEAGLPQLSPVSENEIWKFTS